MIQQPPFRLQKSPIPADFINVEARGAVRRREEGGWVLFGGAMLSILLFLFMGLVVDTGVLECRKKQAQMAADEAALSAALELRGRSGRAIEAGLFAAQLNEFTNGRDGATVVLHHPPPAGPYAGNPQAVEAVVTRRVPITFLAALGVRNSTVAARATALVRSPETGGVALGE
jgi:Flp pilus assembly protein TadG